ncbi:MAG: hypothetical protein JO097_19245 [Acidobacteriaceae bacterium]|nr:hypothetical protein [Acidobacteriaceae bacterium]
MRARSIVKYTPLLPLIAALLIGCGGGGGSGAASGPPPTIPTPVPSTTFPPPPAISPAFVQTLHSVVLPGVTAPAAMSATLLSFIESLNTQMARRGSTVGSNDKEIVGPFISAGGPYLGIAAISSAYSATQLQLPNASGSGINQLFAPMMVPSDHGCLVPASYYYNFGAGPQAAFIVSDFCAFDVHGPLTALFTPIDANFIASYVRNNANGVPSYEVVSFTPQPPSDASTWYVVLFNFTTRQWDLVTSSAGNRPRGEGGDYFASSFLPGPCPSLPVISTLNLALATEAGGYDSVTPTLNGTTSRILAPPGFADVVDSCFNADQTGPPSYNFNVVTPNNTWTVTPH